MAPAVQGPVLPSNVPAFYQPSVRQSIKADSGLATELKWDAGSFPSESSFTHTLTASEKAEINVALQSFEDRGLDGHQMCKGFFPLPTLGDQLKQYARELHFGRGFFVLRGLDPEDYTSEQNILIFLGISSYIASVRGKQTDDGKLFAHIKNASDMETQQGSRPLRYSNRGCTFHNDLSTDILAMQTRRAAASGGDSYLASVDTVLDGMTRVRPDLARLLFEPTWPHDLRRRFAATETRPVCFHTPVHDGSRPTRVLCSLLPDALVGFPDLDRPADLAPLTPPQRECLALLQEVAFARRVVLPLHAGDLTFVNNWSVLHARDRFVDGPDHARYLVRMWLKNERLGWPLPEALRPGNHAVFYDHDDEKLPVVWNVTPEASVTFKTYERSAP